MKLLFVSPIVSRRYAGDWSRIEHRVGVTVDSLTRQRVSDWAIMLVGADRPSLPHHLQRHVIFAKADLDIDIPERRGRREIDKQRKQYCGFVALHEHAPEFVMPLDYDDLVSVRLIEYVQEHSGSCDAFVLQSGYVYRDGEVHCHRSRRIYLRTGSNFVVRYRKDLFPTETSDFCPPPDGYLDYPFVASHIKHPQNLFDSLGLRWRHIPFPSVVWRRNQDSISNAYSGSEMGGRAQSILPVQRFTRILKELVTRRPVNARLLAEFGCDSDTRFGIR